MLMVVKQRPMMWETQRRGWLDPTELSETDGNEGERTKWSKNVIEWTKKPFKYIQIKLTNVN